MTHDFARLHRNLAAAFAALVVSAAMLSAAVLPAIAPLTAQPVL